MTGLNRRRWLLATAPLCATLIGLPVAAVARPAAARGLAFMNLHTGERLALDQGDLSAWSADMHEAVARLLRDHRSGEVHPIDPQLLSQLKALQGRLGTQQPFHVISGYRSPGTNARLASASGGVATRSLHMQGRAIDIRLPGVPLRDVRRAALDLQAGGVGYYERSNFVHLDTGRVRRW